NWRGSHHRLEHPRHGARNPRKSRPPGILSARHCGNHSLGTRPLGQATARRRRYPGPRVLGGFRVSEAGATSAAHLPASRRPEKRGIGLGTFPNPPPILARELAIVCPPPLDRGEGIAFPRRP